MHALLPVWAVRAGSHAPLRCAIRVHHRQARLDHVRSESGVPEDLLGNLALCGHGAGFAEGHAGGFLGRVLLHPIDVLRQSVHSSRRVGRTTTGHRRTHRGALVCTNPDTPLVNWQTVGDTDVGGAGHRQPRIGETPAQRGIFLAVVHVAVNGLAVNGFDVFAEESGDVFVGAPIQRHAQLVAVLGLELVFQVLAGKQISAEPVQVGELLVRQLVQLLIRRSRETGSDEVLQINAGIGPLFARTFHVVRQAQNLAVTVVGADQIRIRDPAVVDGFAGLHGSLQLLNHITLLDDVVFHFDTGNFFKRFCQSFRLILMGSQGFRHRADFLDALGLQFLGSLNEPLHFFQLLLFVQSRGLEFAVNPLFGRCLIGPRAVSQCAGDGDGNRCVPQFHVISPRLMCPLTLVLSRLEGAPSRSK